MNDDTRQSTSIPVALIYGSTREGRFCDKVGTWAAGEIDARVEFTLDVIDPAALALPDQHRRQQSSDLELLRERVARADAFVVVTPEYNHSYPAALKFLIDSVYSEWQAKPVSFVSYGGVSGGLRAVEHLRLVFAELHTVTVRSGVSFANAWSQFDDKGRLAESSRAHRDMAKMLEELKWWATALREARRASPYGRAAA
ncbi:MAG TPA: NAD(P)H-dependent oxidoreductase [Bryobacteraceae bacterium]|nr:NAD(P)H-dependent oxidoreductase [Bryobacteraceae bacterium]